MFLLLILILHGTGRATTVHPRLTKCPVCEKPFVIMVVGSYNTFGKQERDLSSSPFARFTEAQTCPHCLYSSLSSDFDNLAPAEKDAMKKYLADFKLKLQPEEAGAVAAADEDARLRDQDYLGLLIARQCNALRKPDAQRDFNLAMLLFYETIYAENEELHAFYRKRAIESLRRELGAKRFSPVEQAMFTYLLGELLRQDGRYDEAIHSLADAAALAKPLSPHNPKEDEDSCQWIIDWSREQSCRASFAKKPAEMLRPLLAAPKDEGDVQARFQRQVALETLSASRDRDAWRVLAAFATENLDNFDYLIKNANLSGDRLRIEPRLWDYARRQYAEAVRNIDQNKNAAELETWRWRCSVLGQTFAGGGYPFSGNSQNAAVLRKVLPELNGKSIFTEFQGHPTDTVKEAAARLVIADSPWASEPGRLMELNPRFKDETDKIGSQPLRIVKTPPLWSEKRLMANLHRPIRSGDRQAVEFFFRWCRTVGPKTLERFTYYIANCFDALAADTSLWSVPADLQTSDVAEQRFLGCCFRYLHGDDKVRQELLAYLAGKVEMEAALAADCFSSRRDVTVKDTILKHLEADGRYGWWTNYRVHEYLGRVATPADLPRIETIAARQNIAFRDDIEEIILKVRIRELLRAMLGKTIM